MNRIAKLLVTGAGFAGAAYAANVARSWLRFGTPRPARGEDADTLLDTFMPIYDVVERHHIAVAAPAEVTFAAAQEMKLDDSRTVRALFRARELILRGSPDRGDRPTGLVERMRAIGWEVLAESPGREIVMGAVTKPWQPNPVFCPIAAHDFATFAEPDYVKIAWTLRATREPSGGSVFRTETRAIATDAGARRKFRWYWAFLSPGIILIRAALLRTLATASDRAWHIEGDDILPDARTQLTHATTIEAPPRDVWPWLVQMGCHRAGWYSWDILDNAGKRSADRIVPELQKLAIGDVLPWSPSGPEGFEVLRIVPERALVVGSDASGRRGTWSFVLVPLDDDRTRLVTRYRAAYPPSTKMALMIPAVAALHHVMERKQLRTIKHHAEELAYGGLTPAPARA